MDISRSKQFLWGSAGKVQSHIVQFHRVVFSVGGGGGSSNKKQCMVCCYREEGASWVRVWCGARSKAAVCWWPHLGQTHRCSNSPYGQVTPPPVVLEIDRNKPKTNNTGNTELVRSLPLTEMGCHIFTNISFKQNKHHMTHDIWNHFQNFELSVFYR